MGSHKPDGYEYQAANGYWYRKVNGKWKLKHHCIIEEHLGRPLRKDERVSFVDKDNQNMDPSNLRVTTKKQTKEARIHYLKSKIQVMQEELAELESR